MKNSGKIFQKTASGENLTLYWSTAAELRKIVCNAPLTKVSVEDINDVGNVSRSGGDCLHKLSVSECFGFGRAPLHVQYRRKLLTRTKTTRLLNDCRFKGAVWAVGGPDRLVIIENKNLPEELTVTVAVTSGPAPDDFRV